jgi:hypothetical protein
MRGGMEMTQSNSSGLKHGISRKAAFFDDRSPDGSAQVIRYICRVFAMFSHVSIPFDAGVSHRWIARSSAGQRMLTLVMRG